MYTITYIFYTVNLCFSLKCKSNNNREHYHKERKDMSESHPSSYEVADLNIW